MKTVRRPPYPKWNPGYFPCSSLTPPSAFLTPSIGVLRWIRAKEKDASVAAARESTLPPRAFGVYWTLKDDPALEAAGVSAMQFAEEAQALVGRFPNADVNADEQRQLRISLYNPLLGVEGGERGQIVDQTLAILLGGDADAGM